MRTATLALALVLVVPAARAIDVVYPRYPAVSPDGKEVCFAWRGDLWLAPIAGGAARRLTVHPADDLVPVWSLDGKRIAFQSDRRESGDVYVLELPEGEPKRLTFHEATDEPGSFAPDGKTLVLASRRHRDPDARPRILVVSTDGGGNATRLVEARGDQPQLSDDGTRLLFARGNSPAWRKGYRGSAAGDLWIGDLASGSYTRITDHPAVDDCPQWGSDGAIYFRSERGGQFELWRLARVGAEPAQVTGRHPFGLRNPSVARRAPVAVAERWDRLVAIDLATGREAPIPLTAPADEAAERYERKTLSGRGATDYALSVDGKGLALVIEGEVFVKSLEAPTPRLRQLTHTAARERNLSWRGNHTLCFGSDRSGEEHVYQCSSRDGKPLWESKAIVEIALTKGAPCLGGTFSPDGRHLAYLRDQVPGGPANAGLVVRALATGVERTLVASTRVFGYRWSPDGRYLAVTQGDDDYNSEIWLVPVEKGPAINASSHPDVDYASSFSEDGRLLVWLSGRGKSRDACALYLARSDHEMAADERTTYATELKTALDKRRKLRIAENGNPPIAQAMSGAAPALAIPPDQQRLELLLLRFSTDQRLGAHARRIVGRLRAAAAPIDGLDELLDHAETRVLALEGKKPVDEDDPLATTVDPEEIFARVQRAGRLAGDELAVVAAPDGETIYAVADQAGARVVYAMKPDGSEPRAIATEAGDLRDLSFDPAGQKLYFLGAGGTLVTLDPAGRRATVGFEARVVIDHEARRAQKFDECWRILRDQFYDPTFRGKDWAALRDAYRGLALSTRTPEAFDAAVSELLGELNSSHQGIRTSTGREIESTGELGVDFDAKDPGPGLKIARVYPNGPAAAPGVGLQVGDRIMAIEAHALGGAFSADELLTDTVHQPTSLSIRRGEQTLDVVVRPASGREDRQLRYLAWVADRRRMVEVASEGRLGYIHIQGMSWESLEDFERDLYARAHGRAGLVIDVRYNNGGWTADMLLVMLDTRNHAFTVGRDGGPGYPQDRRPFYVWQKPAALLCNEASFSNAEIFAHAFKRLGRGPVVGRPTFGGVISTSAATLIDGATIRTPNRGWFALPDGRDMEYFPAIPDHDVEQGPADEEAGRDPQLDRAVRELLAQVAQAEKK